AGLAKAIKYPLQGLGPVQDFAVRKIKRTVLGVNFSKAHPQLKKLSGQLEEYAVQLPNAVEAVLRKFGRSVHLEQMAQKRIADIAIDFYAMTCVLSRLRRRLEEVKDPAECELEITLAESFFVTAGRRVRANFRGMDFNGDELLKKVADSMYEKGEYPFDLLNW